MAIEVEVSRRHEARATGYGIVDRRGKASATCLIFENRDLRGAGVCNREVHVPVAVKIGNRRGKWATSQTDVLSTSESTVPSVQENGNRSRRLVGRDEIGESVAIEIGRCDIEGASSNAMALSLLVGAIAPVPEKLDAVRARVPRDQVQVAVVFEVGRHDTERLTSGEVFLRRAERPVTVTH